VFIILRYRIIAWFRKTTRRAGLASTDLTSPFAQSPDVEMAERGNPLERTFNEFV
jgi:hypothetical protein